MSILKQPIPIAIDSGAHSIFTKGRIKGAMKTAGDKLWRDKEKNNAADVLAHTTPAFRKYLESYQVFLNDNMRRLSFYVTLDLIYNPKGSWEVYKEMRLCGYNPVPVIHPGEELKWLHKYMDETDYIGIGGLGQEVHKSTYLPWGESVFKTLSDSKGRPRYKTHGFAMTSFDLLKQFPWSTVDSTFSFYWARVGSIAVPKLSLDQEEDWTLNFLSKPTNIAVTKGRSTTRWHLERLPKMVRSGVEAYLEEVGSSYKDVRNTYAARDYVNLLYMNRMVQQLNNRRERLYEQSFPCVYYASGNPSDHIRTFPSTLRKLQLRKELGNIGYLGSFYQKKALTFFMNNLGREVFK